MLGFINRIISFFRRVFHLAVVYPSPIRMMAGGSNGHARRPPRNKQRRNGRRHLRRPFKTKQLAKRKRTRWGRRNDRRLGRPIRFPLAA